MLRPTRTSPSAAVEMVEVLPIFAFSEEERELKIERQVPEQPTRDDAVGVGAVVAVVGEPVSICCWISVLDEPCWANWFSVGSVASESTSGVAAAPAGGGVPVGATGATACAAAVMAATEAAVMEMLADLRELQILAAAEEAEVVMKPAEGLAAQEL